MLFYARQPEEPPPHALPNTDRQPQRRAPADAPPSGIVAAPSRNRTGRRPVRSRPPRRAARVTPRTARDAAMRAPSPCADRLGRRLPLPALSAERVSRARMWRAPSRLPRLRTPPDARAQRLRSTKPGTFRGIPTTGSQKSNTHYWRNGTISRFLQALQGSRVLIALRSSARGEEFVEHPEGCSFTGRLPGERRGRTQGERYA